MRIAINGFGRIGRCFIRAHSMLPADIKSTIPIVAINTNRGDVEHIAHLLKYDSTHGIFPKNVRITQDTINYDDGVVHVSTHRDPTLIPWKKMGVDLVLECSGVFNDVEAAAGHIYSGANSVLVSAPCKGCTNTIIYGINNDILYDVNASSASQTNVHNCIFSAGSCTTNAFIPILHQLHSKIGVRAGFVTTVHSYTSDQNLLDGTHADKRRARSAACSMIPTSTGVSKLVSQILPDLAGLIGAAAIRVPTQNVSLVDFVFHAKRPTNPSEILQAVAEMASNIPNVVAINYEELVSVDFNHTTYSTIFDSTQTIVSGETLCRVVAWYDNEWGFVHRMLDIVLLMKAIGLKSQKNN